jgi:regulator of replication initiation timing
MKLAEALNQRADLQRRIAQLRERLSNNVKVQEGDQPAEKPEDLFRELEAALKQLKDLIVSINRTNQETVWEGKTLTEIIAEKDVLSMHLAALRATLDAANVRNDRYSRNEIKFVRTIDVNALQKKVDNLSRDLRVLDSKLQQANWTTDLK